MNEPASTIETPNGPCPNCGYSLDGLPADCVCPECGIARDPDEIVLWGWARGRYTNFSNVRARRFGWMIFAALGQLYWVFIFGYGPWVYAVALLVLIPTVLELRRRWNTLHPGLIQVRFNSTGCVQLNNLTGSTVGDDFVKCAAALGPLALYMFFAGGRVTTAALWVIAAVFACLLVVALRSWTKTRKLLAGLPDSALAEQTRRVTAITNWRDIRWISWTSGHGELINLRAHLLRSDKWFPIDAEVTCSPATVEHAKAAILQWKAGATQGASELSQQQQHHEHHKHQPQPTAGPIPPATAVAPRR